MWWTTLEASDDGTTLFADVGFWESPESYEAEDPPVHVEDFQIVRPPPRIYMKWITDGGGQVLTANGSYEFLWVEVDGEWEVNPEDPNNLRQTQEVPMVMTDELEESVLTFVAWRFPE